MPPKTSDCGLLSMDDYPPNTGDGNARSRERVHESDLENNEHLILIQIHPIVCGFGRKEMRTIFFVVGLLVS